MEGYRDIVGEGGRGVFSFVASVWTAGGTKRETDSDGVIVEEVEGLDPLENETWLSHRVQASDKLRCRREERAGRGDKSELGDNEKGNADHKRRERKERGNVIAEVKRGDGSD